MKQDSRTAVPCNSELETHHGRRRRPGGGEVVDGTIERPGRVRGRGDHGQHRMAGERVKGRCVRKT